MANDFKTVADNIADALDLSGNEVSELKEAAPLVGRWLPGLMSSNGETHKYTKYVTSPTVGFRPENNGRDFSKSVDELVTVTLKILDWSWASDKAVADAWRQGGAAAFVSREGNRHLAAAMFEFEKQWVKGTNNDATGFAGLEDSTFLLSIGEMVVDGGGATTADKSSCYLLRLNEAEMATVIKGDGMMLGDTIVQNFVDATGKNYPVYYTPACSWVAGQYGGKYSAARIANLTADITAESGAGLTDDKIYDAASRFPAGMGPNLVVTNTTQQEYLRASRTATNVTGAPAPTPTSINIGGMDVPIITTDAITQTEAVLT